ncbi:MAG: hypothetical protein WD845_14485 [Pirellulales bacterium]
MAGSRNTIVWNRLGQLGLFARLALLSAILAAAYAVAAPFAYGIRASAGLWAAAVACGVCWVGAAAALALASLFPRGSVHGTGVAMLVRMFLPLALGVTLHVQVPALAKDGMIYYLLGFYLVALAAETALAVAQVSSGSHSQKAV